MLRHLAICSILLLMLAMGCSDDPEPRDPNLGNSVGDADADSDMDAAHPDAEADADPVTADTVQDTEADTVEDVDKDTNPDADRGCNFLNDSSCPLDCTDPDTWPQYWQDLEAQALVLINEERSAGAECGPATMPPVDPVTLAPALREAARCHSQDMSENEFLSQAGSDDSTFSDRADEAGYTGSAHSQCVGGSVIAETMVQNWMGSFAFCNNIMRTDTTEIGVGFANINVNRWTMVGGN